MGVSGLFAELPSIKRAILVGTRFPRWIAISPLLPILDLEMDCPDCCDLITQSHGLELRSSRLEIRAHTYGQRSEIA
jgi:hypothetical protein